MYWPASLLPSPDSISTLVKELGEQRFKKAMMEQNSFSGRSMYEKDQVQGVEGVLTEHKGVFLSQ